MEVCLRGENQQLREVKVQQEFLPGEGPQFFQAAHEAQEG